ncbi:VOC family protein [Jiangella endophytica]|uniref:VOC family protein n=1 Tax=Jiangella endophytica TaxID=1623398 RepID=UPI000E340EB7|nr:VOC family protein [Jiangella endophytica]
MANEITVPVLPCRSIDEIDAFYTMLGFTRTYYQTRPNPCIGLQRDDLQLQFFGMPDFVPEDSYGTCVVLVPDTTALFEAFAAAMRRAHGRILVSGIPRMTRPRKRKNAEGRSGFSVVDPGGNWIRIMAATPPPDDEDAGSSRLTRTLRSAVVMGDSHGEHVRAAEILDAGLERYEDAATTSELVEALAYRAELAVRTEDPGGAAAAVARARALPLTAAERDELAPALAGLDDVEAILRGDLRSAPPAGGAAG